MDVEGFYVRYLNKKSIFIEIHALSDKNEWAQTLFTVADLIRTFQTLKVSGLSSMPLEKIILCLPLGVSRSALDEDCFSIPGKKYDCLDGDCLLASLGYLGTTPEEPLIIKAILDSPLKQVEGNHSSRQNIFIPGYKDPAITLLENMIRQCYPFDPSKASFRNDCLESRLDKRLTSYELDGINDIKILLSSSGSGKTRQLLELLHKQFGYFFVAFGMSFGSSDVTSCFFKASADPANARFYIETLYFVRVFVCSYLVDLGYNTPPQILLAQLRPRKFFGHDIFSDLFSHLAEKGPMDLRWNFKHRFDFAVIDNVQSIIGGCETFGFMESGDARPFFSPLVFFAKSLGLFPNFIVSATGINFESLAELMLPSVMPDDQSTSYQIISGLKPLYKEEVESFIRLALRDQKFIQTDINEVVNKISSNPLFWGRGQFLAFLVDSYLEHQNLDMAMHNYCSILSDLESQVYPVKLRFLKDDGVKRVLAKGIVDYMIHGKAKLFVKDQAAFDLVRLRIGFCEVENRSVDYIRLEELTIVECLRNFIGISDVVLNLRDKLSSSPNPQMTGLIVEYLVAYAFVASLNPEQAMQIEAAEVSFIRYIISKTREDRVFFPDHCCGPDIIYKHKGTIYILQINFLETISKQERVNAVHTTDPNYFYWDVNRNCPLQGSEKTRQFIVKEMAEYKCKRFVFHHSTTIEVSQMEGVEFINESLAPHFFDPIGPNIWNLLTQISQRNTQ